MNFDKYTESGFSLKKIASDAKAIRLDKDQPTDVTFADMVMDEHSLSVDDFYEKIGVDPNFDTIQNIFTQPSDDIRWLVPELIRDALRLGYRAAPIWPNVIAYEEQVSGLNHVLPHVNMSEADPKRVGEGETIPLGTVSYGSKTFRIYKYGRGIKITDEVMRYVSLNVLSIYLQDFGVRMGYGVDTLAIQTLINGEQTDTSEAAPVIGINPGTGGTTMADVAYRDFLRLWLRMTILGRSPSMMLTNEAAALDIWDIPEFKNRKVGAQNPDGAIEHTLNFQYNLPQNTNYFLNGMIPSTQVMVLDPSAAMIKMNAVPLMVESERIVSNQTEAFYATFTTGFAKMFTEACVLMDASQDFASKGFPDGMNYDPYPVPMT